MANRLEQYAVKHEEKIQKMEKDVREHSFLFPRPNARFLSRTPCFLSRTPCLWIVLVACSIFSNSVEEKPFSRSKGKNSPQVYSFRNKGSSLNRQGPVRMYLLNRIGAFRFRIQLLSIWIFH